MFSFNVSSTCLLRSEVITLSLCVRWVRQHQMHTHQELYGLICRSVTVLEQQQVRLVVLHSNNSNQCHPRGEKLWT